MNNKPVAAGKSVFNQIDQQKLLSELEIQEGCSFLDVGCGSGAYSIAVSGFAGQTGHIYAFDLWEDGIEALKREIHSRHISNIRAGVADVSRQIPVSDDSIDVCLIATVLHDLIEAKTEVGTLREVGRVLKPGGMLAIIEFKKIEGPFGPPVGIRIAPDELDNVLSPYFFSRAKTTDVGPYTYLSVFTNDKK